jgi:hypothetical protein
LAILNLISSISDDPLHSLGLLDSLSMSLARPDANPLVTAEPVVAGPHDMPRAIVRNAHPGLLDHPPAPAGFGEDGVGVVVHSEETTAAMGGPTLG